MKKTLAALASMTALALASLAVASPAATAPSTALGACLPGWYVNPDETHRKPTPTPQGLKFEKNQLVHHGATGSIEGLKPGTFSATKAPDQPSFFSVEVRNADGSGYATLRWNHITSKWNMVTGGQFFENASPSELVKMTTPPKSDQLLSFGVGYTNSPPGTVATVVRSVTFRGVTYSLKCAPSSASSSASSAPASSAPASQSASPSGAPVGLPVTGSRTKAIAAGGGAVVVLGVSLLLLARRRTRFETP